MYMKIVCIGQPKTATKSMAKIFQLLGFNTNNNPRCLTNTDDFILLDNEIKYYFNDDTIEKCLQNIELFEAFHDYPYSFSYEYIYSHYPDTKFILTIRDSDKWFTSLSTYQDILGASNKKLLYKLYGYETFLFENKEQIIDNYNIYNENIQKYFQNKPNSLLIINISDDDNKYECLCNIGNFLHLFSFQMPIFINYCFL